jgi:REP element-mobilizing transposase RayT
MKSVSQFRITRRNLPHWQEAGSTYALAWRTGPELILDPHERTLTLDCIRHWDEQRWIVSIAVVMPDHVHVIARPLAVAPITPAVVYDLGRILHTVKGFTAKRINRGRNRNGSVWQDERHDRMIRDDRELQDTWDYMRNNPVEAGLVERAEDYLWLYERSSPD